MAHMYIHHISITIHFFFLHILHFPGQLAALNSHHLLHWHLGHFYLIFPGFCQYGVKNLECRLVESSFVPFPLPGDMGQPIHRTLFSWWLYFPSPPIQRVATESLLVGSSPVFCPCATPSLHNCGYPLTRQTQFPDSIVQYLSRFTPKGPRFMPYVHSPARLASIKPGQNQTSSV
jgi:hypothetical protein